MEAQALQSLATLLREQRIAALGTLHSGHPMTTMVAYAVEPDFQGFLLHLSGLARHARALQGDARAGLMIHESDSANRDPHTLARVSLEGTAKVIAREDADYDAARQLYLGRLPSAAPLFGLGDFNLYRIVPEHGRFVAGFAQSYNLGTHQLQAAAAV